MEPNISGESVTNNVFSIRSKEPYSSIGTEIRGLDVRYGGTGTGGGGKMESRVAVLEERTQNTDKNISDIKSSIKTAINIGLGTIGIGATILIFVISGQNSLKDNLHELDKKMASFDNNINGVKMKVDKIETRLDKVDERFDKIDARFEKVDAKFERIDTKLESISSNLKAINESLEKLSNGVNK